MGAPIGAMAAIIADPTIHLNRTVMGVSAVVSEGTVLPQVVGSAELLAFRVMCSPLPRPSFRGFALLLAFAFSFAFALHLILAFAFGCWAPLQHLAHPPGRLRVFLRGLEALALARLLELPLDSLVVPVTVSGPEQGIVLKIHQCRGDRDVLIGLDCHFLPRFPFSSHQNPKWDGII